MLVALGGLLKYIAFPLAAVAGAIGVIRDETKWLAAVAGAAGLLLSLVTYWKYIAG